MKMDNIINQLNEFLILRLLLSPNNHQMNKIKIMRLNCPFLFVHLSVEM